MQKLGKIISGNDAVIEGIKKHKIKLVILAEDASDKTKKNIEYVCTTSGIKVIEFSTIEKLSSAIGKKNRAIIGVTDNNFSEGIMKKINGGDLLWTK